MNQIIIGGGEVGYSLHQLLGEKIPVVDTNIKRSIQTALISDDIDIMHICFPHGRQFKKIVMNYFNQYEPKMIVIHSTVPVGTTYSIQTLVGRPTVIYAPTRGVHSRFVKDMKRYTKLWASAEPITDFDRHAFNIVWGDAGVKTEQWNDVKDLELAKVLIDTTYYGWLISFRFLSDSIAEHYGADKEKIWDFADEIQDILGNRPRMFSNVDGIGGHCVLPNLELNNDKWSDYMENIINVINSAHRKKRVD